jgi:hypothetical protein
LACAAKEVDAGVHHPARASSFIPAAPISDLDVANIGNAEIVPH